ncbi:(S)-benzoin forming benzil reductase [Bacillus gobiensis]|uniref:(S)-benzoin forming benzil reductase n=1 Tax=Bacillus gobiensis TaxID=1441095 RepID=UPI003D20DD9D
MKLAIVTGSTKGLGRAITERLFNQGVYVNTISRSKETIQHERLTSYQGDLSDSEEMIRLMQEITEKLPLSHYTSVTLFNNAGTVTPIKRVGEAEAGEVIKHYSLNLIAPVVLSQAFVKWTSNFKGKKTIVNISSGAAYKPSKGWSAYCSSKAGLDMFTKVFGLEQEDHENQVKVISFSPGIMNTEMQGQIRSSKVEDFQQVQRFKDFHEKGQLRSPDFVAGKLMLLLETEMENGRIYDIKDFL